MLVAVGAVHDDGLLPSLLNQTTVDHLRHQIGSQLACLDVFGQLHHLLLEGMDLCILGLLLCLLLLCLQHLGLLQHCLPALKKSSGAVVNLIDIYSEKPLSNHPLYCASKAGLAALTRSWAKDLAPDVRVNGVSPGAILWPESNGAIDKSYQKAIVEKTPLATTGNPDDIARTVVFLMCDAPFITGQIISVDGGRSLNM